jgi:hypothetical protein
MKQAYLIAIFVLIFAFVANGATNQFLSGLNAQWTSQNASNVLSYIDAELSSHPDNPQALFARGVAAAELQMWARGATNYVRQSIDALDISTNYTSQEKASLLAALTNHLNFFIASINVLNEPTNSVPQTNTTIQAEMFLSLPGEFPYFEFLSSFKEP